jgi:hypothetical protein
VYLIGGQRVAPHNEGFAEALAAAYGSLERPRCLCLEPGVEMYVARQGHRHLIKRMPCTGDQHAPDCPSHEPRLGHAGAEREPGSAVLEDPASGMTMLRLGFAMSVSDACPTESARGRRRHRTAAPPPALSLRALLHYLWDQAGLTRWHPGYAGKRSWAVVRRRLLLAAENKLAKGCRLANLLYVPEMFSVDQGVAIRAHRASQLARAMVSHGPSRQLMLLIGEVKEIRAALTDFNAVIKHVPDLTFVLSQVLYGRLESRFSRELSLWSKRTDVHMIVIATFDINLRGTPEIAELSLMPTNAQWLPVDNDSDLQRVERLVREGHWFTEGPQSGLH